MKEIYCERCLKQIKIRSDLVTAFSFFRIMLFHDECYAKSLKGTETVFISNSPINGASGNFVAGLTAIVGIIFLLTTPIYFYFVLVFFLPLVVRLYSWFRFERHLEP